MIVGAGFPRPHVTGFPFPKFPDLILNLHQVIYYTNVQLKNNQLEREEIHYVRKQRGSY